MVIFPLAASTGLAGESTASSGSNEERIREAVQLAIINAVPSRSLNERRRIKRHPFPYPVYLTPLGAGGSPLLDDTVAVLGRHISQLGLDFYHREPLPYRKMIASLPCGPESWVGLLMNLTWCRFNHHGWYDSGGQFLQPVSSPLRKAAWK